MFSDFNDKRFLLFQKNSFKAVVKDLESAYFAEYGYVFPLTGKKHYIYVL